MKIMNDLESILALWRELETAKLDYVLATVVAVEGSSYRKPGAHMLLGPDGRRAGTVSGGCLEAEVAKRAWWLTADGPVVGRYSTAEDDGDRPYGSGCGGVVYILLERRETAGPLLAALQPAFEERTPLAIATILEGPGTGRRAFAGLPEPLSAANSNGHSPTETAGRGGSALRQLAERSLRQCESIEESEIDGAVIRAWANYSPARPGLWIFGAGDDAIPLHRLAREMGWYVSVADGRSHLATRQRFPAANDVRVLPIADLPGSFAGTAATEPAPFGLHSTDAAVVMAHSFEQDSKILAALLVLDPAPAYIGVLGPQRRTRELLAEAARLLGISSAPERVQHWLARLHAPMGLDLGGEAPAAVALSVLAEIQQSFSAASGLPLRQVRADRFRLSNALQGPQETSPATQGEPSTPGR
jgi:xanthine/CO dehydrogenase XdhC/CoxF family maturation factor